jgi:hypothetical protein
MTDTPRDPAPDPDPADAAPDAQAGEGAAMRRALLHKLPRLDHDAKTLLAGIGLDRDRELLGAVELDVDAFLVPLAATRRKDRR